METIQQFLPIPNFREQLEWTEKECKRLMAKYFLDDWKFKWSRASKSTAARCIYKTKTIRFTRVFVMVTADRKVITNTILHEIAHALTPKSGHNKDWQAKALELGCDGKRCLAVEFHPCKSLKKCKSCDWSWPVHTERVAKLNEQCCPECSSDLEFIDNPMYQHYVDAWNGTVGTPVKVDPIEFMAKLKNLDELWETVDLPLVEIGNLVKVIQAGVVPKPEKVKKEKKPKGPKRIKKSSTVKGRLLKKLKMKAMPKLKF